MSPKFNHTSVVRFIYASQSVASNCHVCPTSLLYVRAPRRTRAEFRVVTSRKSEQRSPNVSQCSLSSSSPTSMMDHAVKSVRDCIITATASDRRPTTTSSETIRYRRINKLMAIKLTRFISPQQPQHTRFTLCNYFS